MLANVAYKIDCSNPSGCRDMAIFTMFSIFSRRLDMKEIPELKFLNHMARYCHGELMDPVRG